MPAAGKAPTTSTSNIREADNAEATGSNGLSPKSHPKTSAPRNNSNSSNSDSSHTTAIPRSTVSAEHKRGSSGSIPVIRKPRRAATRSSQRRPASNGTIPTLALPPRSVRSNATPNNQTPSTSGTLISIPLPRPAMPPFPAEQDSNARHDSSNREASNPQVEVLYPRFPLSNPHPLRIYPSVFRARGDGSSARRQLEYRVMQWNEASEQVAWTTKLGRWWRGLPGRLRRWRVECMECWCGWEDGEFLGGVR